MRLQLTGLVVNSQPLFMPGGDVHRWVYEINGEMYFEVQRAAPLNKRKNKTAGQPPVGTLVASVFSDVDRVSAKTFTIHAGSSAPYTKHVVFGTGRIYARDAGGRFVSSEDRESALYLPANPGYGPARWRQSVSGQAANDFITRGYNQVARRHAALKRLKG